MMFLDAAIPLIRLVASEGASDPYGNPEEVFTVSWVRVFAWWVPDVEENVTAGRAGSIADIRFLAPAGTVVDDRDEFLVPGMSGDVSGLADGDVLTRADLIRLRSARVVGEVQDWCHGPFGWAPGVQVNLRFVEG